MSDIVPCAPPCPVTAPINIPGPAGGNGVNAYTFLTAPLTCPSVGLQVVASVVNSSWMIAGQLVRVEQLDGTIGAYFYVSNVPVFPYTTVTLTFEPQLNPGSTEAQAGSVIAQGALIVPSGRNGDAATTQTTADFTLPAVGSSVTIAVQETTWIAQGSVVVVGANSNGDSGHFLVTATNLPGPAFTGTFMGSLTDSASGTVITHPAIVSPSSSDGLSAFTKTTANFNLPAAPGSTVTASVVSSLMFAIGQNVFASDGTNQGSFSVTALPSTTQVTLKWLGEAGDSPALTTILAGAKVVPNGSPGPNATAVVSDATGYTLAGAQGALPVAFGPVGGFRVPANTIANVGDSIEWECYIDFSAVATSKTVTVNFGGITPIISVAGNPGSPPVLLKLSGRIVLKATGPDSELSFAESVYQTVTSTNITTGSFNPAVDQFFTLTLTQNNAGDTSTISYFEVNVLPV